MLVNPKIFFLICISFIVTFLVIFVSEDSEVFSELDYVDPSIKYILLYEVSEWMETVHFVPPDARCVVTHYSKYLPRIEMFDAVLFSGQTRWNINFPKVRSPHQYYVFVDLESPQVSLDKSSKETDSEIYNLTMTYRRDSDIYWPYGFISDRNITYLSAAEEPNWLKPVFDNEVDRKLLVKIRSKNKTAAWFVSNCYSKSGRAQLVRAMQKVIDVDIYGKCGPLKCFRNTTTQCYKLVERKYFFYLSFENSLCRDYITEKVFNIMSYNVVPVVYGGANYTQHLPPHSYIDANDFPTAKDLANFLQRLTRNTTEYVRYFWWKKYYRTVVSDMFYNNLCDKLHDLQGVKSKIDNIETWWKENQCQDSLKIRPI